MAVSDRHSTQIRSMAAGSDSEPARSDQNADFCSARKAAESWAASAAAEEEAAGRDHCWKTTDGLSSTENRKGSAVVGWASACHRAVGHRSSRREYTAESDLVRSDLTTRSRRELLLF